MIMSHDNVSHSCTSSKIPFTLPPFPNAITPDTTEQLADSRVIDCLNTAAVVETNPFHSSLQPHSARLSEIHKQTGAVAFCN